MAVTKELTGATPYINASNKVDKWDLEYTYENDNEGDETYFTSSFSTQVEATDHDGNVVFTPKAKGSWDNADIVALCPVPHWDNVFASQVDSVITNPPVLSVADTSFTIPS